MAKMQVGEIYATVSGGDAKVVEYVNARNIVVEFINTGFKKTCSAGNLRIGMVADDSLPSFLGVGIVDISTSHENRKPLKPYKLWKDMLSRCYSGKSHYLSYKGCSVSENFKRLSYFTNWCKNQKGFGQEGWHLDKDILGKGNKVYSEDTCCFLPKEINCIFGTNAKVRGKYPIGVQKQTGSNRFMSKVKQGATEISKCGFLTPEDAFSWYKAQKEARIRSVAEQFKDQLDPRAYNALMSWQIEITD